MTLDHRRDPRACISYWNRRLGSVAPTPRTKLVLTEPDLRGDELVHLLDGNKPQGYDAFMSRLNSAVADELIASGGKAPVFIRTGHSAFKHSWRHTCGAGLNVSLKDRVLRIVECATAESFPDIHPLDVWAVREFLPTEPVAILDLYGGLPLVPELRAFIDGGGITCVHAYWPVDAISRGLSEEQTARLNDRGLLETTIALAGSIPIDQMHAAWTVLNRVAFEFARTDDGAWSVDLLETDKGWHVIDMAPAERSWHDPACRLSPLNVQVVPASKVG